jgi:DNA topoisomerase-1
MARRNARQSPGATADDALLTARAAGLRYVNADDPGISRRRYGRGFAYRDADGRPVRDRQTLARIRSLAVPPAWTDVWICASSRGHIQATGRDARGRKQYRYHAAWRDVRDEAKFERTIAFAEVLPALRRRVELDLGRPGLPRPKVVAAVVRLLETTLARVGNEEYARANRSFGLTTLRDRHAEVNGSAFRLAFNGKAGKKHEVGLRDTRLARIVGRCQDLPGQRLFQYLDDDGQPQRVSSDDVNDYLREATGEDFSAKDFRTWAGTVLAAQALQALGDDGELPTNSRLLRAVERVARDLGNTPAVCRQCYIHPAIIDAYLDGSMAEVLRRRAGRKLKESAGALQPEEQDVLKVIRDRLVAGGPSAKSSAA